MGKHKPSISIDQSKCSVCGSLVCVGICPMGVLEVDLDKRARLVDANSCTGCGVCADLCPSKAIILTRGEKVESK